MSAVLSKSWQEISWESNIFFVGNFSFLKKNNLLDYLHAEMRNVSLRNKT